MRVVSLSHAGGPLGPVSVAESSWDRTRGLLGRTLASVGTGLLILRCNSVHTVGMRYAIDVVFIDADGVVLRVVNALAPLRFAGYGPARHALEMEAGRAEQLGLVTGVRLSGW